MTEGISLCLGPITKSWSNNVTWYSMGMNLELACLHCSGQPNRDFSFVILWMKLHFRRSKNTASSSSDLIDALANFIDGCETCFEFWDLQSLTGAVFTWFFPSTVLSFRCNKWRYTEERFNSNTSRFKASVSWSRVLTILITLLRRRSWVAEPEIAIWQVALINSDLSRFSGRP